MGAPVPMTVVHAILCCLAVLNIATGFSPPSYRPLPPFTSLLTTRVAPPCPSPAARSTSALHLLPPSPFPQSTAAAALLLADGTAETWRQYVPLVVSLAVITDILLGNPVANLALAPMRRATLDGTEGDSDSDSAKAAEERSRFKKNPNERLDTAKIGQEAVQRARYSMELRTFLDENKSQEQKYDDMKKEIDEMARKFDEKIDDVGKEK